MKNSTVYYVLLLITVATYFVASKYLFDRVYEAQEIVVDELFHLPQGMEFCKRNFTYWDPKITTPPGLYMISTSFLGTYFKCSTYNLRFINLVASTLNLILFASILKYVYGNTALKTVLQALNLAILPPLYFFSHVYYTDTISLMFLLAYSRMCLTNTYRLFIMALGYMGVFMRQTNIVWVAMMLGHKALDLMLKTSRVFGNTTLTNINLKQGSIIAKDIDKSKLRRYYNFKDALIAIKYHLSTCFSTFFHYINADEFMNIASHATVIISFLIFLFWNGSVVMGDKSAHEPTLHLPQMFYFFVFYGIFGLPYVVKHFNATVKLIFTNKVAVLLLTILFLVIVHYNTVVHPYLLADNRHYTFYVWNRWYGKYEFAKYVSVPVYVFLLVSLYANLKEQNCISFLLPYSICATIVLSLQKMIEVRYFLIPYIILRLRFPRPSLFMILCEFLWYSVLNVVTFHIFFNKEIVWKDFVEPQRIIW